MDFVDTLKPYLSDSEIASLLDALDGVQAHGVLLNPALISDEEFLSLYPHCHPHPIVPHAFSYNKEEYDLGKSLLYDLGAFSIQDPSSMMPPYFLAPQKGDHVLDLCAAPGGKTIAMALQMDGEGVILSNDISYPRAKDLSSNIERMGINNVIVSANDFATVYTRYLGAFDRILLDAPCSGSAMFRKNELAKADWSEAKVMRCQAIQKELMELAYAMLAPGGELCYSTCSFSYQENEGVVLPFLAAHDDMRAVALPDHPTYFHHKSLPEAIHFLPHLFHGEGQFLCLLRKDGASLPRHYQDKKKAKESPILSEFGLTGRSNLLFRDSYHSLACPFPIDSLSVLRYGVIALQEHGSTYLPAHALAKSGLFERKIELSKEQAKKYLRGETFPLNEKDGFAVLTYRGRPLGFAKLVHGAIKNHYPKGLRHDYPDDQF